MEMKAPKATREVPAKKPYQAPALKDWGTLKDITLSQSSGAKSDGAKGPYNHTH